MVRYRARPGRNQCGSIKTFPQECAAPTSSWALSYSRRSLHGKAPRHTQWNIVFQEHHVISLKTSFLSFLLQSFTFLSVVSSLVPCLSSFFPLFFFPFLSFIYSIPLSPVFLCLCCFSLSLTLARSLSGCPLSFPSQGQVLTETSSHH